MKSRNEKQLWQFYLMLWVKKRLNFDNFEHKKERIITARKSRPEFICISLKSMIKRLQIRNVFCWDKMRKVTNKVCHPERSRRINLVERTTVRLRSPWQCIFHHNKSVLISVYSLDCINYVDVWINTVNSLQNKMPVRFP